MNGEIENFYDYIAPGLKKPRQLVMFLHGLGSNGQDLISLAPHFAKYLAEAVFISPDAPFSCDMVPPGYPNSYQWFSLQSWSREDMLNGIKRAQPILEGFIDKTLKQYELSADKLALVGFSQGTMMSLYAGPRYKNKIAGVVGYSGALIGEQDLNNSNIHKIPIHLIHGVMDNVVPVQAYYHARENLESAGFALSGHTSAFLMHSIDPEGIDSGGQFLKSIL